MTASNLLCVVPGGPVMGAGPGVSFWAYGAFVGVVLVLLALDLGVFHRRAHAPSMRESAAWTAFWIALALLFGGAVYLLYDRHAMGLGLAVPVVGSPGETVTVGGFDALKAYTTAYLVEKSLSMDNVFVIAMIFASLGIPAMYQHRVLFWGIVGALVMRGVMIGVGAAVVMRFSWVVYVFGALLIFSALKMALSGGHAADPSQSRLVRLVSRFIPVTRELDGQRLFTRRPGVLMATPLFVALLVVEATDLMFAVDSIPAVFAITGDPFIVFTSNIMAILGLRSLYFCLASAVTKFRYLKAALVAVLLFVGIKMCLVHTAWKIPTEVSLSVVLGLLTSGVAASLVDGADGWRRAAGVWRSNRLVRRSVVLLAGSAVIGVGVLIAPLPGPGLTVLGPLGLGILASEFLWARRIASRAAAHERGARGVIDRVFAQVSRVWIVPVVAWFWLSAWLLSEHGPGPGWVVWSLAFPIFTPVCYIVWRWHRVRASRVRGPAGPLGEGGGGGGAVGGA